MSLTIQPYSEKNVLVQGDFDTYAKDMKRFRARWSSRLKSGEGWLVPVEFEGAVRMYFGLDEEERPVRKTQKAPAKPQRKTTHKPPVEVPEEEEPVDEEPVEEEPPKKTVRRSPPPPKPTKRVVKKEPEPEEEEEPEEEPEEDLKSVAEQMKKLMAKYDSLSKK